MREGKDSLDHDHPAQQVGQVESDDVENRANRVE